jgi:hypothetical protein
MERAEVHALRATLGVKWPAPLTDAARSRDCLLAARVFLSLRHQIVLTDGPGNLQMAS